jgi:hypothetical protein
MAKKKRSITPVLIDDDFPDLSKDPVFAAKHEKAEKLIAEFGIPEAFKTKTKKAKSVKRKA